MNHNPFINCDQQVGHFLKYLKMFQQSLQHLQNEPFIAKILVFSNFGPPHFLLVIKPQTPQACLFLYEIKLTHFGVNPHLSLHDDM